MRPWSYYQRRAEAMTEQAEANPPQPVSALGFVSSTSPCRSMLSKPEEVASGAPSASSG
jgi:hypothetical protein